MEIEERINWRSDDYRLSIKSTRQVRELLIEVGFYRVITDEEIANTYTNYGKYSPSFILDKVKYDTDHSYSSWLEEPSE